MVVKRPYLIYAAIDRHKEFQFIIRTFANTLYKDIVTWEGRTSNHIFHPGTMTILSEKLFGQISSSPKETLRRCKQSSWEQLIELSREPLLCRQWVHTTLSSYRRLLNQQSSCEKPTKVFSIKLRTLTAILLVAIFNDDLDEDIFLLFKMTLINFFPQIRIRSKAICFPMKSLAPLLKSCGVSLSPFSEHQ